MKVLNKILPYRVRIAVPMLGMTLASMFGACSKEESDNNETVKFVWGPYRELPAEIGKQVAAAANRKEVSTIILESDGEDFGGGTSVDGIFTYAIEPMTKDCPHPEKLRHTGSILRPAMRTNTREQYKSQQADSAKLANMGYTIVSPVYTPNPAYRY